MHFLQPDSHTRIRMYAAEYIETFRKMTGGQGITQPSANDDVFAVLMEKGDVARLLMHPNCHKIAAIVGIAPDLGQGNPTITISLLAVGSDGKVLPEHWKEPIDGLRLEGEEVWPKKIKVSEFDSLLPDPTP